MEWRQGKTKIEWCASVDDLLTWRSFPDCWCKSDQWREDQARGWNDSLLHLPGTLPLSCVYYLIQLHNTQKCLHYLVFITGLWLSVSLSSHQVNWRQSRIPFSHRFDKYLDPNFFQHRVNTMSNVHMKLFLTVNSLWCSIYEACVQVLRQYYKTSLIHTPFRSRECCNERDVYTCNSNRGCEVFCAHVHVCTDLFVTENH